MIKKEDIIADVLEKHPEVGDVMLEYGLHCIGCRVSAYESIESGCKVHGMEDEKIDAMIEKMNEVLNDEINSSEKKEKSNETPESNENNE